MEGYNGTIFAYGQTGAGKTFTMMGLDIFDEELQGIVPRAVAAIFEKVNYCELSTEFTLRCSMLEIYKESLKDLLDPDGLFDLKIKESPHRGIFIDGLVE